jgi:DinB family protein
MVFTRSELVDSLQHEIDILVHLVGKIDRANLDFRPTPKQRSTIELLRYLTMMGPMLVKFSKGGRFDPAVWTAEKSVADARDFDQTLAALAGQRDFYARELGSLSDADFRADIEMFGRKTTRGAFLVNMVLCGHAAYRTQLFCYLKACGREELTTMNLWAGADPPVAVA